MPGATAWTWHASRDDAEAWLNRELEAAARPSALSPEIPLGLWLAHWYAVTAPSAGWAERTRAIYQAHLAYFRPIHGVRLSQLTPAAIQAVVARLLEIGPDRPTVDPETGKKRRRILPIGRQGVRDAVCVLRRALESARDNGLLATNPARLAVVPKVVRVPPVIWTRAEVAALVDALRGDPLEALFVLSFTAGLRAGELLALKWSDLDLAERKLTVQRTRFRGGRVQEWPKSRRPRTIGLSDAAISALVRHRDRQHSGAVWIFERLPGRVWSYDGVAYRLARACRLAGVEYHPSHTGRHQHASHLIDQGVPISAIAERLGHADASVTARIYFHATKESRQQAIDAADILLFGSASVQVPPALSGEDQRDE